MLGRRFIPRLDRNRAGTRGYNLTSSCSSTWGSFSCVQVQHNQLHFALEFLFHLCLEHLHLDFILLAKLFQKRSYLSHDVRIILRWVAHDTYTSCDFKFYLKVR